MSLSLFRPLCPYVFSPSGLFYFGFSPLSLLYSPLFCLLLLLLTVFFPLTMVLLLLAVLMVAEWRWFQGVRHDSSSSPCRGPSLCFSLLSFVLAFSPLSLKQIFLLLFLVPLPQFLSSLHSKSSPRSKTPPFLSFYFLFLYFCLSLFSPLIQNFLPFKNFPPT